MPDRPFVESSEPTELHDQGEVGLEGKPMKAETKTALASFRDGDHKDWTRVPTTVRGVFIVYMPMKKGVTARSLSIELNPVDKNGNPTKKSGIHLRSTDLEQMKEALNNDLVTELVTHIESENPSSPSGTTGDVIAIA